MHKIKSGTLTAGMVKNSFKGKIEMSVAIDTAFLSMISVKVTPAYSTPATVFIGCTGYG